MSDLKIAEANMSRAELLHELQAQRRISTARWYKQDQERSELQAELAALTSAHEALKGELKQCCAFHTIIDDLTDEPTLDAPAAQKEKP